MDLNPHLKRSTEDGPVLRNGYPEGMESQSAADLAKICYSLSWDNTLPTKVHLVKAMVFPVVMYGCEGWTVKKAERWRIDAFELWCWRRLLRVPWTPRKSNQSILKEISPGISLEGMMETLATSCEELTHWKRLWCWEGLGAGGKGNDRGWDGWMASPTWRTWVWVNSRSWWWTGRPGVMQFMGSQRVGHDWATELKLFLPHCWQYYSPSRHWEMEGIFKILLNYMLRSWWAVAGIPYPTVKVLLRWFWNIPPRSFDFAI